MRRPPPALGLVHLAVALALAAGCGTEAPTGNEPPTVTSEPAGYSARRSPRGRALRPGTARAVRAALLPRGPSGRGRARGRSKLPGADELGQRAEELVGARDAALVSRARELYADPRLEQLVPHPALRAAVVSLLGTLAEPAIEWLLEGATLRARRLRRAGRPRDRAVADRRGWTSAHRRRIPPGPRGAGPALRRHRSRGPPRG